MSLPQMSLVVCLCAGALCQAPLVFGQADNQPRKVEELRAAIESLQKSLKDLERPEARPDARITELGSRTHTRVVEDKPAMVVRIYDVSDLFAVAPAYPAVQRSDLTQTTALMFPTGQAAASGGGMGGMGGMGGGMFTVKDRLREVRGKDTTLAQFGGAEQGSAGNLAAQRTSIDDLISSITQVISPKQWADNGGESSIAILGNSLLISTTDDTHRQIEGLLGLFRKRWGTLRTVSVRAWWLWLTDAQLAAIVPEREPPQPDEAPQLKLPADKIYGVVDEAAWKKIFGEAEAAQSPPGYRAAVTCYNGQTVHTLAGEQRMVVTSMRAVGLKGDEEKKSTIVYQPESQVVQEGLAFQVTPLTSHSGRYVVLDLHSRINQLQALDGEQKPQDGPAKGPDHPVIKTQRLSTTLRAPVDRVMLAGGMTMESLPEAGGASLYLFVKVSVQDMKDDYADATAKVPEVNAKEQPEHSEPQGE